MSNIQVIKNRIGWVGILITTLISGFKLTTWKRASLIMYGLFGVFVAIFFRDANSLLVVVLLCILGLLGAFAYFGEVSNKRAALEY